MSSDTSLEAGPFTTLSRQIWSQAEREGINIFGAGNFGRSIARAAGARGIAVHAFLSSTESGAAACEGIPIRGTRAEIMERAPTWVGVFNREAHSDYARLHDHLQAASARASVVWPQFHYECLAGQLGWRFWLHPLDDYRCAHEEQRRARSLLEDEDSRAAFDAVLGFRQGSPGPWRSPVPHLERQYLPQWLREHMTGPLRVIDGGAYHGETLREIASAVPVAQAWTFEPDPKNYAALEQSLANMSIPTVHLPVGLSDRSHQTAFSANLGEASHATPDGQMRATMVALDECLPHVAANYLKLDVEGNELAALHGARSTILRERPVLAIAAYHRWDDLWRIPLFIGELNLGYRMRLRLHGHNSFECVIYAY